MNQIWAVARQMIAEGVRMKIALVFLVLIGAVVLGLPFSIEGDRSLTGRVQSFLSYGLTAVGFFLGLLTVFMSRSLSDELVGRQIFLVLTKPMARWQFILGKWLGITLLNAVFLSFSGLIIYGMVHYIIWTNPPLDDQFDKVKLTNEVLVARHALRCKPPDFRRPAKAEFERNLEEGFYADLLDFNRDEEIARLTKKHEARWRVIPPLDTRTFLFENVLCERTKDREIQIRYKAEVSQYPPDEIFRAVWRVGDPRKGTGLYPIAVRHVVGRYHSIAVPADAVAKDHTLRVQFVNENPFQHEPQFRNVLEIRRADEVEVLFVVGSFEWNLFRLLVLVMCKLMFLAAVALLMATVFSFPVACLGSFTVYVIAGTRAFIADALDMASADDVSMFASAKEFVVQSIMLVHHILSWLIPDFARFDAVETFVNGRNVSLRWVLEGIFFFVDPQAAIPLRPGMVLEAAVVLGLAILLFHRREVAEVSI